MNKTTEINVIVPGHFDQTSQRSFGLSELFVGAVMSAYETAIEVKVEEKSRFVTSGNSSIKELVSMYLKSGRLEQFYRQLVALSHKELGSGELSLKVIFSDRLYRVIIQEIHALPNLHLKISKVESGIREKVVVERDLRF